MTQASDRPLKPWSSSQKPLSKQLVSSCSVCAGPAASHLHYGAVSCYSCRAFFRRGIGRNYTCVEGRGECEIDFATRRSCQQCRFNKCLSSGMKVSMVDNGREGSKPRTSSNSSSSNSSSSNSSSSSNNTRDAQNSSDGRNGSCSSRPKDDSSIIQDLEPLEPDILQQVLSDINSGSPSNSSTEIFTVAFYNSQESGYSHQTDEWKLIASLPNSSSIHPAAASSTSSSPGYWSSPASSSQPLASGAELDISVTASDSFLAAAGWGGDTGHLGSGCSPPYSGYSSQLPVNPGFEDINISFVPSSVMPYSSPSSSSSSSSPPSHWGSGGRRNGYSSSSSNSKYISLETFLGWENQDRTRFESGDSGLFSSSSSSGGQTPHSDAGEVNHRTDVSHKTEEKVDIEKLVDELFEEERLKGGLNWKTNQKNSKSGHKQAKKTHSFF